MADPSPFAGASRADRAAIRELTFAFRDATVHVQIARGGLHGQVVPSRAGEVEVHVEGRPPRRTEVDEQGWFSFAPLPAHALPPAVAAGGVGGTAMTDWLTL